MSSLQVITATAKEWIAALNRLTPATAGRKAMPILSMIHVDPAAASLFAVGRDVTAETALDAAPGEGEPFLVGYTWLRDAITSTTGRNRNADVQVTAADKQVTVETLGYKLSIETMSIADFPEKPEHHTFASHSAVDAVELRDALGRALIASSKDETLPLLNSVHFESAPNGLKLWATDRYRLVSDIVIGPGYGEGSFTVQAAVLKHMAKVFKAGTVYVDSVANGPVIFKTDNAAYTATPVSGKYPPIASLFDSQPTTVVDVNRIQLLEAAKVAHLMSEWSAPAFLSINTAGVRVRFNDGIFGPDMAPLATGTRAGADVEIALNTRFLLEAMSSFRGETVRLQGGRPDKAFTFTDGGADSNDSTIYRHLVMTVRMPQ